MMPQPGDLVSYLGHVARVIHVFTNTANIRFTEPVTGQSRQQDVYLSALLPAEFARAYASHGRQV